MIYPFNLSRFNMGDTKKCARHKTLAAKGYRRDMTALFKNIDMPTRLEMNDLTMCRGKNILFEGLSGIISSGDVLWVQGDNGIGKTTLLEALAGLSRPDAGDISWYRSDKLTSSSHVIAYQPHSSFTKATLTAREDLTFWAKLYHHPNLVDETLELVGLSTCQSVPTQNLSAGQRRRLALGKLAVSGKPIWIMDEPGAAMDADGSMLIDDLIGRHVNRGGSAIIASHDKLRKLSFHTRKLILKSAT